jgi:DNA-binding LacI/PurR family transcriptional regulator
MEIDQQKATIRDVARVAGVSISSVSRVINNIEPYSDTLRHKVETAIIQTGYRYTPKKKRSYHTAVVVLIPDSHNPYFMEIIKGIEDQSLRYGLLINIVVVMENPDYKRRLLEWLKRGNCGGIILCSSSGGIQDEDLIHLYEDLGIPIVLVNRKPPNEKFAVIKISFSDAMYRATRYILSLGHRRIAYLGGPEYSQSAIEKRMGIEQALAEEGLTMDHELYLTGLPTIEWGFHGTNRLLDIATNRRPTAIIAFNDLTAFGALHALRLRKLNVPNDISVIGFDDIAMAAHANPPLTTISPPKYEIGSLALQTLVQIMNHSSSTVGQFNYLESPLIIRESTTICS